MIDGLTPIYGINTQAQFVFRTRHQREIFAAFAKNHGCFVQYEMYIECSGRYISTVVGSTDSVEAVARVYRDGALITQPSQMPVG